MIIAAVLFLHIKNRVCKSGYQLIIPVTVKYGGICGQGHYSDSVTAELYFIRLALHKIGVIAVGIFYALHKEVYRAFNLWHKLLVLCGVVLHYKTPDSTGMTQYVICNEMKIVHGIYAVIKLSVIFDSIRKIYG